MAEETVSPPVESSIERLLRLSLLSRPSPLGLWKYHPIEKNKFTLPPREELSFIDTVAQDLGYGWTLGFYVSANSPDVTMRVYIDEAFKIDSSIRTAYNGGLTQANPRTQWVAKYDTSNNNYSMYFTPNFPGIPHTQRSKLTLFNPLTSSIFVANAGAIMVLISSEFTEPIDKEIKWFKKEMK